LIIAPSGDLIIGGQGNAVYEVDPTSGAVVSANAGGGQAYHMSLDPSRTKAWSAWSGSPLIEVPLNPFGNGIPHTLSGDDTSVLTLAWDPAGNVYYTSSGGGFGLIDLTNFVTSRKLTPPADHGMAYDPYTGTLMVSGGNHISQISANPTNMQVISDLDLGTRGISVQFDQGTVDGQGHVFFADNNGKLVFVDYSASKLIGATNNFVTAPFLAPNLDDVAPIGLLGNTNTADLKLLLGAAANPAPVHTNLTLTLTVTNKGPDTATGVQLTTTVPGNVSVVSVTPSAGTVSNSNGNLLLTVSNLASQATASLTLVVQPISGPFVLRGSVIGNETDPFFFDNFASLPVSAAYACLEPPAGVISWWPADGNANDVVGTNNGTLSVTNADAYAPGEVGSAFVCDGAGQYVSVNDSPSLHPTNVTIECWAMFDEYDGCRVLIGKPVNGGTDDSFVLWNQDGTLHAQSFFTTGAGPTLSYNFNPAPGVWHHLAYSIDNTSSNQVLYVDGQAVASASVSGVLGYDNHPLLIGADVNNGGVSCIFSGLIDEPTIYNRALSAAEIQSIYFAGPAGKCGAPAIVPVPLPSAVTNLAYAVTLTLAHATPAYQFSLLGDSGPLPAGITLSASGLLSGTTTQPGSYPIHVQGTDASNEVAQAHLTLDVVTCDPPPLGLLGWWRAEGDATDAIGVHNGTIQNNVTFAPGQVGQAFSFDGNSAYVDLGQWSPGAQWTVEAWVSPSALPGGRRGILGAWNNCQDWGLAMNNGRLGLTIRPPGGCSQVIDTGLSAVVGAWYHLVGTCDGAVAKLYLDGQLVNSAPVDPNYIGTASGTRIGGEVCCGDYFPGLVDEASIYDRPLSAAEVLALYTASAAGKCAGGQPPTIATAPQSEIVVTGTNAVFTAAGGGSGPFTYQWFLNQVPVPGATNATLTLSNLAGTEGGYYTVAVSNPAGTLLSAPASLTVMNLSLYAGITIDGIVGRNYEIDYVTNLSNTNWTTLTTFTLQNSPYLYIDTQSPTNTHRFYRAILH
ncbi:MAG: DUF11 domain-containing protein, partial [Verrucomicrobia bacterium]|nr:DUF11 domain-containing protein [Verrucomicrobiota bacterium]